MELRNFIAAKKREGVLAPGVDTNVQRLMDKYSAGGTVARGWNPNPNPLIYQVAHDGWWNVLS